MKKILAFALAAVMLACGVALAEDTVLNTESSLKITVDVPEGYTFAETDYGDFIGGLFKPADENAQTYYTLLVAFSEEYAERFGRESRLNDLTQEELDAAIAELTSDFASPEITMATTGLDTIVIVVNEQGSESEYATILTVYHGYFVQVYIDQLDGRPITDEEIQIGLDIMTSLALIEG